MSNGPIRIPRRIDTPGRFVVWTVDEVMPPAAGIFVGIAIDNLEICFPLGLVAMRMYQRFRDGQPNGIILHWAYWVGIYVPRAIGFPNAMIRRWFP